MATAVFITSYAEETRMYAWMATLALAAVTTFCLAFVMRRRGWIIGFGLVLAIMLYTHGWALFFGVACGAAWLLLVWQSADRKGLVRDGILGFAIAAVLFLPWLPTLAFQAAHTGAPWSSSPGLGVVSQVASLLGGWATAGALSIGALAGLIAIWFRQPASAGNAATEATPERQRLSLQSIAIIAFGTVGIAWLSSQFNPAWSTRYMAAVIGPILLILAAGAARAGVVGVFGVVVAVAISLVSPVDNVLRKERRSGHCRERSR